MTTLVPVSARVLGNDSMDDADGEAILAAEVVEWREPDTGERALALAVLRTALHDLSRARESARTWLLESEDEPGAFLFTAPALCAYLGIDLDAMRDAIRRGVRPRITRVRS